MVTGTVRASTWAPGCPQAARNSGGIAGPAADGAGGAGCGADAGGAALAHPATAAAVRTRTRTAIRFIRLDAAGGGLVPGLLRARLARDSDMILVTGRPGGWATT